MSSKRQRLVRVFDSLLVAAAALAIAGVARTISSRSRETNSSGTVAATADPVRRTVREPQVLFMYFASSECPVCARSDTKKAVRALAAKLEEYSHREGEGIRVLRVGGTVDWSVEDGMKYLSGIGDWDEMVLGSNWANRLVMKFLSDRD